jgi:hypothetical protein
MNLKIMPVFENYFGDTMQQNCPWWSAMPVWS